MRRRAFAIASAASACALAAIPRAGGSAARATRTIAIGDDVDGIVLRGRWLARVTSGDAPSAHVAASPAALGAIVASRSGTTLTLVLPAAAGGVAGASIVLRRIRGVATSGDVDLALDDPAGGAAFLDLAGIGRVRALGSVPLLRVTTSGTVRADLAGLVADEVRAHARQHSRLAVRATRAAHLVALDAATIALAGGAPRVAERIAGAARIERSAALPDR